MTAPAPTVIQLAAWLQVNRRRIAKWRSEEKAPASLDLQEWRRWLMGTGRGIYAARISPEVVAALFAAATPAGDGPPAESASGGDDVPADQPKPSPGAIDLDRATPPPEYTLDQVDAWWKAKRGREQALEAAANRKAREFELMLAADCKRLLEKLASGCVAALADTVWLEQRAWLDGIATERPELLRQLREAHDLGVLKIRTRLAGQVADLFRTIANPKGRP